MKTLFFSRKMLYFALAVVVLATGYFTALDPEIMRNLLELSMVLIGGQALADGWAAGKTSAAYAKSHQAEGVSLLSSRKLVYFVATVLLAGACHFIGLDSTIVEQVIRVGMVAIGGQALADGWTGGRTSAAYMQLMETLKNKSAPKEGG